MATPSSTPDRSTTYTFQVGDTPSRIAVTFGVSLKELIAANSQITDWARVQVGQLINLPANATWSSPTREPVPPTPSAPAQTYPPLPAIAVVANGKFTQDSGGFEAFSVGTTFRLELRFDGGKVIGSGSRPTVRKEYPDCTLTFRTRLTFSGTFDPLIRRIMGTVKVSETVTVPDIATEYCKGLAGAGGGNSPWSARVSEDAKHLSGSVTPTPSEVYPFVATISPAD